MIEEIRAIIQILNRNIGTGLDRYELKKILREDYNLNIGPKQVQNYLQSFFRNHVSYDRDSYKYSLKDEIPDEFSFAPKLDYVNGENRLLMIQLIRAKHLITYEELLLLMKNIHGLNFESSVIEYLKNLELNEYFNNGNAFIRESSEQYGDYVPFQEALLRFNNTVAYTREENNIWEVSTRLKEDENILRLFYLLESMERGKNPIEWKRLYYEFKRGINETN